MHTGPSDFPDGKKGDVLTVLFTVLPILSQVRFQELREDALLLAL